MTSPVIGPPSRVGTAVRWAFWRLVGSVGGATIEGEFPAGGCVVVGEHVSHTDTPAVLVAAGPWRGARVAAAADYWFPVWWRRWLVRGLGAGFAVRRDGGGTPDLLAARDFLLAGGIVVVFPQGTRRHGGTGVGWRSGADLLATSAGVPIVPVVLEGTAEALPVGGRRPRFVHVTVRIGAPRAAHPPAPPLPVPPAVAPR